MKSVGRSLLGLGAVLLAVGRVPAGEPAAAGARPAASRPARPRPVDELPTTVSPAIARFMKGHGQDLPNTPLPAATGTTASPFSGPPGAAPPAAPVPAGPLPPLDLKLEAAPLEPTDQGFPINLATALRLADARPLVVAAAQAGVWTSEAELTRAKVLWVPTALIGFDYLRHDGGGPDFNKGIMTAPSVNYFEAGAGLNLYVNLTDAYFQPLIARRNLDAAHWDTQTAKNDALLKTADAYFRVHQYRGMYTGALYQVKQGRALVAKVDSLSGELVSKVEVERARTFLADLEQRAVSAREAWRVASADLTQVLRLDPRAVVVPLEHDHAQVTLIDPGRPLDDLMSVALVNRPEIEARRARVKAAEFSVRREKMRPAVPVILVGGFQTPGMMLQGGVFALGPNSSMDQYRGRGDVSVQAVWQFEAFGLGNLARIKAQRGQQSKAIVNLRDQQDAVAAEVNRALARVQSAAARISMADRSLRTGIVTFNGHLEGLGQTTRLGDVLVLTFRTQEAVYSLDLLSVAFREYFNSVSEYNRAQFELFHALGYPASELARIRPLGEPRPVNTARPAYLPPVGHGPPPATR